MPTVANFLADYTGPRLLRNQPSLSGLADIVIWLLDECDRDLRGNAQKRRRSLLTSKGVIQSEEKKEATQETLAEEGTPNASTEALSHEQTSEAAESEGTSEGAV